METGTQEENQQIATKLISLAMLAESVSRRSAPVRLLILWILRPAEAVAHKMIADMQMTRQLSVSTPATRTSADDARHLAELFLYLATALEARSRQELAAGEPPALSIWNVIAQRLPRPYMIAPIKAIFMAYPARQPIDSS